MENLRSKTWHSGGGDNPLDSSRHYRYRFNDGKSHFFRRRKHRIRLHFDTDETTRSGDGLGHNWVLGTHPFTVQGINVMDWFKDGSVIGKVELDFVIDGSFEHIIHHGKAVTYLDAKFSDAGQALIFKLTFGGK